MTTAIVDMSMKDATKVTDATTVMRRRGVKGRRGADQDATTATDTMLERRCKEIAKG